MRLGGQITFYGDEAEGYFTFWFVLGLAVNFLQSNWALAIDPRISSLWSMSPEVECSVFHLPRAHDTQGKEKQLNLYKDEDKAWLL